MAENSNLRFRIFVSRKISNSDFPENLTTRFRGNFESSVSRKTTGLCFPGILQYNPGESAKLSTEIWEFGEYFVSRKKVGNLFPGKFWKVRSQKTRATPISLKIRDIPELQNGWNWKRIKRHPLKMIQKKWFNENYLWHYRPIIRIVLFEYYWVLVFARCYRPLKYNIIYTQGNTQYYSVVQ